MITVGQRVRFARACLLATFILFIVLYLIFAVLWPITNQYSYECEYKQQLCDLGESSPFYTQNQYTYNDTLIKRFSDGTVQKIPFQLSVIPNTHLCAIYCYQGNVQDAERDKHYNEMAYVKILAQATTQTANVLGTVSVYIIGTIICVAMLVSACLGSL